MEIVDAVGLVILAGALLLASLVGRRFVLTRRGGCLGISLRLAGTAKHRWVLGLGRFDHDRLVWFRLFSFAPRPRHEIDRSVLAVVRRRRPVGAEALMLPADAVVFECESRGQQIEVALPEPTAPGFLAWLESAPPRGSLAS